MQTTKTPIAKKRRLLGPMTPNACTNCKKAKTQCSGSNPACNRCADRNISHTCRYELQGKVAKDELLRRLKELEKASQRLEEEVRCAREKCERMAQALSSLVGDHQRCSVSRTTERDKPGSIDRILCRSSPERRVESTDSRQLGMEAVSWRKPERPPSIVQMLCGPESMTQIGFPSGKALERNQRHLGGCHEQHIAARAVPVGMDGIEVGFDRRSEGFYMVGGNSPGRPPGR